MADLKKLARFSVIRGETGYELHVEDDDGETLELLATREQLDVIADGLDELLAEDEDFDAEEDEEDEEED